MSNNDSGSSASSRSGLKPVTCLDAEEHSGEEITDVIGHYLGCIEFGERQSFYESLSAEVQRRVRTELRRIQYLRHVLEESEEASDKALIAQVNHSMKEWRSRHADRILRASRWRRSKGRTHGDTNLHDPNEGRRSDTNKEYDPTKDLNAYIIQFDGNGGITESDIHERGLPVFRGKYPNQKVTVDWLLRGQDNYLDKERFTGEDGKPSRIRYFHFPANNMQWVEEAMTRYYGEHNTQFDDEYRMVQNRTQANTLLKRNVWVGQVQGRGSPSTQSRHLRPLCEPVSSSVTDGDAQPTNLVLFMPYLHWELDRQRNSFSDIIDHSWSKQQRLMREEELRLWKERRTERQGLHPGLAADPDEGQGSSRCQTHRHSALITDRPPTAHGSGPFPSFVERWLNFQPMGMMTHIKNKYPLRDKDGRLRTSNALGQLLYDSFRLYETMNNYRDRKLVDSYLYNEPPIHTRRTLDQAYYWTLPNTRVRDRDQVVYRGTAADPDALHHYRPDEKVHAEKWTCRLEEHRARKRRNQGTKTEQTTPVLRRFASRLLTSETDLEVAEPLTSIPLAHNHDVAHSHGAEDTHVHRECLGCREAIKKVPRIVMVDQLWMWILDDSTVITFFPKRYGVNRQDRSGVHKAIRQRFSTMPSNYLRSAYDVALIIIDECSNLFFDRTKTDPRQPQVVDIFSEAIGNMAQKSTISFQHLWHWANELAQAPTNKSTWVDLSQMHVALLNITPEGKLQRETKDIIEELGIMLYISRKQKEVLKAFKRHAGTLLDPQGTFRENESQVVPVTLPTTSSSRTTFSLDDSSSTNSTLQDSSRTTSSLEDLMKRRRWMWNGFRAHAGEVLQEHEDHMEELQGLERSAEHVNQNLEHLLSLKQQQASVLQAWQAIRHGEEAVKQGRAIMIFTVITIIFVSSSDFSLPNTSSVFSDL
ncbi:hypothetical protein NLU13_8041 [Sarocladium strictum]|uniref:Uncharacterized protein n=1 Tax=Sarocladium strictum TaxID=5046 RepID=A0AA39GBD9_SARSR|nr:hypothetical protein NLU13_8041 [Sarocladium strictum]